MTRYCRAAVVTVGLLAFLWSPSSLASEITYIFDFVVSGTWGSPDAGVDLGDRGTMTFVVNTAAAPDPGGSSTETKYRGAVVGGGVTIGARAWTFGGAGYDFLGQGANYAMVWNDVPMIDPGEVLDGLFLKAPLTGPPNEYGLPAVFFSAALIARHPPPNDALTSLSLPTSLDLADFNALAEASFGFGMPGSGGSLTDTVSYNLDIEGLRVVPEPATWLCLILALAAAAATSRRRTSHRSVHAAPGRFNELVSTASRAARARPW